MDRRGLMMGRPRKEPKSEVPAKDTKLEGILKDLRNNKTDAKLV